MSSPSFDVKQAHRWFAVECNNRAWDVYELPARSEDQVEEMLDAAHAAAFHWQAVGKPLNALRALHLLAAAYLLARLPERAGHYAQQALLLGESVADQNAFDRAVTHRLAAVTYTHDATLALMHRKKAADFEQGILQAEDRAHLRKLFPEQ